MLRWIQTQLSECKNTYTVGNKYVDFAGLNVSAQVVEGVLKHTKLKRTFALKILSARNI